MSQLNLDFRPPKPHKPFDLQKFIRNSKIIAIEILSAVVFFAWLLRAFLDEIRRIWP